MAILNDTNPFNKKAKLDELEALLGKYVPGAEALRTKFKKYNAAYKALTAENAALEKQLGCAASAIENGGTLTLDLPALKTGAAVRVFFLNETGQPVCPAAE